MSSALAKRREVDALKPQIAREALEMAFYVINTWDKCRE